MSYNYDIHGLVQIKANFPFGWLNSMFSLPEMEGADIALYEKEESVSTNHLTPLGLRLFYDQKTFVHKCMSFLDAHLAIKDIGRTTVIQFNRLYKRFRAPLEYFFAILQMKLLDKGFLFFHAGCVAKDEGILLPAFSDTGKTNTVLRFVEAGYKVLGDDMIITDGAKVLSFPTTMTKATTRPFEKIPFLRRRKVSTLVTPPIKTETIPTKLFFLVAGKKNTTENTDKKDLVKKLILMTESTRPLFPFPSGVMLGYYFARGLDLTKYITKREEIITRLVDNCQPWVVTAKQAPTFFELIRSKLN